MSLARFNPKRDRNEREIIDRLRETGCLVEQVSGDGVPDLLVWNPKTRLMSLLEVKDGSLPPSKRPMTAQQVEFHRRWKDAGAPVFVVTDTNEACTAAWRSE